MRHKNNRITVTMSETPNTPVPRPRTSKSVGSLDQQTKQRKPIPLKRSTTFSGGELGLKSSSPSPSPSPEDNERQTNKSQTLGRTTTLRSEEMTPITQTPVRGRKTPPLTKMKPTKTTTTKNFKDDSFAEEDENGRQILQHQQQSPQYKQQQQLEQENNYENVNDSTYELKRKISYLQQDNNHLQNEMKNKKNMELKLDQEKAKNEALREELREEREYIQKKNAEINHQ